LLFEGLRLTIHNGHKMAMGHPKIDAFIKNLDENDIWLLSNSFYITRIEIQTAACSNLCS
jgi:hypothetical protein